MFTKYGLRRVIEPPNVLPVSAWKLDNTKKIHDTEMLVSISKIHLETSSFKQLCIECNHNPEKIKHRIIDIISKRGKLHNPITDTGGVLFGEVQAIGKNYNNVSHVKAGDEIICNTSLASVPIFIESIEKIDFNFGQIVATGYAIMFNECPIVKHTGALPVDMMLFGFDVSGSIYKIQKETKGKKDFLIVANNMITSILVGYSIRKAVGPKANIVCVLDKDTTCMFKGERVELLLDQIFDQLFYLDILKPIECIEMMNLGEFADLSVNCADIPGAETINVLSTKEQGVVFFTNLINNYNIAIYITESISKEIEIKCAVGYAKDYESYNTQIVSEVSPYLKNSEVLNLFVESKKTRDEDEESFDYRTGVVEDFVCESRVMSQVLKEVIGVAKYNCSILIYGETGVGKDRVAEIIHKNSHRKMQPFIKVNCASIQTSLLESEFFGYEKGSFTGANTTGKKGYFEIANNGTIFLDEIGELSLELQAKLLRVLQDGEFYRVGGEKPVKTNVRVISATNRDLEKMVEDHTFRQDLFYRLNVFPITIPPLRERAVEIPPLIEYLINKYNESFQMNKTVSYEAMQYLKAQTWKGNIRELENMVQRLMISSLGDRITSSDVLREESKELISHEKSLEPIVVKETDFFETEESLDFNAVVRAYEKKLLQAAEKKYGTSRKVAKALGISQSQYMRKKTKYQL